MDLASISATHLLDRPKESRRAADGAAEGSFGSPGDDGRIEILAAAVESKSESNGLGSLLRAPSLVLLATTFLIEGYRWLGVLHIGGSALGSVVFGTVGLALMAFLAPTAALVLRAGRRSPERVVVEELVIVVAIAVTVATSMALIVGGPVWRAMAGTADLLLATTALSAVILGERERHRTMSTVTVSTFADRPNPLR